MKEPSSAQKKHTRRKAIRIALAALLCYCALSMLASAIVFRVIYPRKDGLSPLQYTYDELSPACERTAFTFSSGKNTLSGWRYDAGEPKGLIVVVNGIGAGADAQLPMIMEFVQAGWSVATWDATGVGLSEGRGMIGLQQIADDLTAFLTHFESSGAWNDLPVILYGHSAGAYAAAVNLDRFPCVSAVVCISGFDRPVSLMYRHAKDRVSVLADLQYPFLLLENVFLFGTDANDSAREAISDSSKPVLIVGGDSDDLVPNSYSLVFDPEAYANPNVRCQKITSEYRNEHSTPWLSPAAAQYRTEHADSDDVDKALANELDAGFVQMILEFLSDSAA